MHQLLHDPERYEKHIQRYAAFIFHRTCQVQGALSRYAASVVVSMTYGKRVESIDEWIVTEMMASMNCKEFWVLFVLTFVSPGDLVCRLN